MRIVHTLAAISVAVAPLPASAAMRDAVMNKEGYWGIDVDDGACAASMMLQGGSIFLLRGYEGQVTFGLFSTKGAFRKGQVGRIQTDASGIEFEPHFGDDSDTLYNVEEFNESALAALRTARHAQVLVDGRAVASMTLEGTGFEGALDGVIACSKGESGWWGKGVDEASADEPPKNKEGVWTIRLAEDGGYCVAGAGAGDGVYLEFPAVVGRIGIAVAGDEKLPRGRKGRVETDTFAFDFTPGYGGSRYFVSDDPFDSQALFALRRAKSIRVKVDGRTLIDVSVEETGFPEMLDDLAACSHGEKGWWGEGAKQPPGQ